VGSQVSSWEAAVATLPDLTKMESVTYVNEIDVRKIAAGQPVVLTLDSDPTKKLTGTVTSVANVGEQRPNTDAKVFEVRITIEQADTTLRPGMTTGNTIETLRKPDVLSVPLEALHSADGVPFVYRQTGARIRKQEVVTGDMNDDAVVILQGLESDDKVYLTVPPGADKMDLERIPGSTAGQPPPPTAGGDTALKAKVSPADTTKRND
jgi:hypothetical protein